MVVDLAQKYEEVVIPLPLQRVPEGSPEDLVPIDSLDPLVQMAFKVGWRNSWGDFLLRLHSFLLQLGAHICCTIGGSPAHWHPFPRVQRP